VRNKLLAHRERLEPDRTRELLSVQADALAKTGEILDAIDAVVKAVTGSDQVRDWSWVMIAFEPWAEGVLATLRRDVGSRGAGSR
jgi:hypothetical protein